MRKTLLLAFVFLTSFTAFGQDFSNKGKDFWVGYGYHTSMLGANGGSQDMVLYFATDQVTNITITIPANGYTQNITTGAGNNVVTSTVIPKTGLQDARLLNGGLSNNGIHITSDKPMVAYAHVYNGNCSGATILYPTNTLGREYYSVNYKNWSNQNNANCWFYVMATDTGTTTIEITPQANIAGVVTTPASGGWTAGTTYTVNLTQGQIYNVMGILTSSPAMCNPVCTGVDLTGSRVKSINNGTGCKKISVFSGSGRISITCNNNGSSSDNYMVQAMPRNAWGKKYLTVQANGNQANNIYRVCVSHPAAVVKVNGVVTALPLQNNFYYEIPATNQPLLIEADSAIMVAQYFTSQNACTNGNPGDPEVIYLSAVEQSINKVLWNATPNFAINSHFFNVVIPNAGTALSSFLLDGAPVGGWVTHPQEPNYSYLRMAVGAGPRVIQSDSGFNAIAYGFANAESYGYNAGTNIKDLYQQIGVQTTYGIETTPSVCTNSPFKFKVSLPYIPDSMRWVFNGAAGMLPNNNTVYINNTGNVAQDSTTVVNGKTLHWYSAPLQYTFTTVGVYPIDIITFVPNGECGSEQDIPFDLTVSDPPVADFAWTAGGCVAEPYQFTETTPQVPKPTYSFWWNFDDPGSGVNNTSNLRNPVHTFTAPGTYNVRYASITTPGCLSDTIVHPVIVPDFPNATIAGTTTVCLNSVPSVPVTFTGTLGTAEYVFTYNINGGAPIVSAPSTGGTLTIPAPTNVAGTFVYNLVGVRNELPAGTPCSRVITGQSITVQINPLPAAAITGATTVCLNAPPPTVTFTGSGATAPYTFNYTINGAAQAPIVSNAAGTATVTAPTNVSGTFIYEITQVTDASSTTCTSIITGTSTTITVQDLPNAAIASSTTAVCQNATQPTITFTGSGGTAPYTFNYTINSVAQAPVVSNAAGVATLNVPTTTVGSYVYEITQVTEGSPQACVRAITGQTITVDVNPLPNAAIAGAVTVCLNSLPEPVVTFTGSNSTAPYTFEYTINGVPQAPVVSNAAGIATVNGPTTAVGTFVYAVTQVTDGSSTACVRPISGTSTTITIQDLPNGVIAGSATSACLNSAPPPTISFTGSTGTAPYTFTYMINGVTQPTVVSNAAGVATINVPTNVATTYTYELTAVSEASAQVCSRTITGQTWVVVINPLPTAVITGTPEVCRNDPSPFVTFTGSGATAPYTFSYTINGTPQPPVASNAAGIATVPVPTTVAGTFTYELTSVQDASSTLCSQVITGQQTIVTINQLPTAAFTYTAPSCETRIISFTDASAPNSGNLNSWTWDFGDGPPTSTLQNPTHVYAAAGVYNVTLTVTTDKGCTSDPIANVPVNIDNRPQAGFIIPEVCLSDTYAQFFDTSKLTNAVIDRWDWDFGDPNATIPNPNTSNLQNPTHSYTATGNYNVRLIVWNSVKGCRDTITQVLQVNGSFPTANFSVNNPTTLCANDSVSVVEASTVFPGNITKVEIWFDNVTSGPPAAPDILDNFPVTGKVYKHLYPNFQSPLTRTFQIRYRAYSGGVCLDDSIRNITVNAAPLVQFNNMPPTCWLVAPFQITQASEVGGVPGTGTFSGPGVSPSGMFNPQVAGIGTHRILYTYTSTAAGCVDTMSNTITVRDTAHAKFAVTLPSCEQTATLFTNQSTAPGSVTLASTVWDFGDATGPWTFGIATPVTHTYANPGTYTVTMHTVAQTPPTPGCLSTDTTAVITIDANHHIQWDNASGNETQPLCVNTSIVPIKYSLTGGANNVSFSPPLPPGLTYTVAAGTPIIVTISGAPTVPSNYSFDIITSGNACVQDTSTINISVAPDHAIALRAGSDTAQSLCLNTPISDIYYDLSGGASGVNISGLPAGVNYTVTGNELRIYGTPTSIPPGGPGYTITTTGNACLFATKVGNIFVQPYAVPSFTVDKPGYCIPNAIVKFTNTTTPTVIDNTYLWDFGDGSSVNQVNPTHWYTSGTGPFTVRLTATTDPTPDLTNGQPGCVSFIDVPMTTIHPQPKADFVFSKPAVCIGDNVTITDNTDGKDGIVNQWNWDLGDGTTRIINPVTHTYGDTITYNITMYSINTHGCNSDTLTKPYTVYPYPKVNAGPDKYVLEGGSVQLDATAFARQPQYAWTPVDFLTDSKILTPRVMSPKTDMTYRLTVTGQGGCQLSDDVFVKLLKFPVIPNTFTPNNDGINDTWRIDFLNTYPDNRVQIFTRTGKIVFESRGYNTPWDGTIKGKPLPFDTYYYIIEPGNGRDPITGYVTILK